MQILWIQLDKLNYTEFFANISRLEKRKIIFTPNPEIILESLEDKTFKKDLKKADYLVPDGIGLYLAAQILEVKNIFIRILLLPLFISNLFFKRQALYRKYWDRICGSDLTRDLLYFAEEKSIKIFILDPYFPDDTAKCEAQETFSNQLKKIFPDLKFHFHIYKDKKEAINEVNTSWAKIFFSTLWMKKQERSVIEIMEKCPNIILWLWVWSSFDYFTGFQKRAPSFMSRLWFEWFYRIFTSPQKWRTLKRIYNAIFVFTWKVLKSR